MLLPILQIVAHLDYYSIQTTKGVLKVYLFGKEQQYVPNAKPFKFHSHRRFCH